MGGFSLVWPCGLGPETAEREAGRRASPAGSASLHQAVLWPVPAVTCKRRVSGLLMEILFLAVPQGPHR